MDFDQLSTFLEVARTLNFSRAAEKRFRTQPAISAQIRSLEEEIGAKLFDRSRGKVRITEAGRIFQTYAEHVLERKKTVLTAVAELDRQPRGEIAVGANEATCLHILPDVFAAFKEQFPSVSVNIRRGERAAILDSIHDNTLDFGVISAPVDDPRLKSVIIHHDRLVVITKPGHPLTWQQTAAAEDVAGYPLLLPKFGRTREAIEEFFQRKQLKYTVSMELDSSELLKRFVAAGVGVGFIAAASVAQDVQAKVLAAVPLEGEPIPRILALVYRKDMSFSRATRAFMEITLRTKAPDITPTTRADGPKE